MLKKVSRRTAAVAASITLVISGTVTAQAVTDGQHDGGDGPLARGLTALDRGTAWSLTGKLKLTFPTFHTEGLAFAGDRMFLSSVEIIEPTRKYPTPQGGYDRTPGKGIGHLFVMDRQGHLQKDITLGEGDNYHPGGIESDGRNIWVDVAQYRPDSSAIIYRVDATTLQVHRQFDVRDHIGGIVADRTTGHLVGNSWGSRRFYEWTQEGRQIQTWKNPGNFIDYQDCQYVPARKMLCGGIAGLPQTPAAGGGTSPGYELGGLALIDLRDHSTINEVPFQYWSSAGHVMTRNPLKMAADDAKLTLWAAPDNGEETNGTELFTYQATPAT
ncbi:DUF6454 family protein [Amycolatopsis sp. H20-H5]|uniref:DUF6454 family protein n=1 Tax=Amycolatopsis sp. H20-H5 TaxID=3046309 RepID=UPI002DB711CC|nr:DUF6454 family protein [Amycolatopsis sp. H20-H5]MEC3979194.1 DUF6454 family protein [Amycolatopsis sp. H20-H5]